MIVRLVKMKFEAEKVEDFLALFEKVKVKVRAQDGCSYLELLQDAHDPTVIMTHSYWESEAALDAYRHSDFFKDTWQKTKALFRDRPEAISFNSLYKAQ